MNSPLVWSKMDLRTRIIIVFGLVTAVLVFIMARTSYLSARDVYMEQLKDQVVLVNTLIASEIDTSYLKFLLPDQSSAARSYYKGILLTKKLKTGLSNIFIFNSRLDVLLTFDNQISPTRLQLNRKEILSLLPGQSITSVPFQAVDGEWYLWGFYRLNNTMYLGIQENARRLAYIEQLAVTFTWIGALGIAITLLAAWLIARSLSRPVNALRSFSREIGAGNFNAAIPENIVGEMAVLKDAMVRMRDDLNRNQAAREQMLAQIAHEIRNPLGGIELLAGLVHEDAVKDSPTERHSSKILKEVHGLKEQINSFLSYSRPVQTKREKVNVKTLANEIREMYRDQITAKKIQFKIETLQETVDFDKGHLRQVLINLFTNSMDVLPQKGRILLESYKNSSGSILKIHDSGPGISTEKETEIFNPFFTTKAQGSGLGLAICRKLCQENNARITLEREPDWGCTFVITMNGKQ